MRTETASVRADHAPRSSRLPGHGPRPDAPAARVDVMLLLSRFGSGGVERVSCLLSNGLANLGFTVAIAAVSRQGPAARLVDDGVAVTTVPGGRWLGRIRGLGLLLSVPALARRLRRTAPGVFLSPGNHTHVAATLAHLLAGSSDTRLVLKITNPLLKERHGAVARRVRKAFYGWAFGRADRILVLSRHGERQIAEICARSAAKARFVHNPYVATPPAAVGAPASDRTPTILCVGRLSRQKNHELLLRALARLKDMRWRLVVLGDGPLEPRLKDRAAELGLSDRVAFEGFVSDPAPFYGSAHLLALTSDWEDLPAVVLEALAVGLPVVATRSSQALTDVMLEANHGDLVPLGDDFALAATLATWLRKPRQRVPFLGAHRYSIENGVREHADALRPLLRAPEGSAGAGLTAVSATSEAA